MGKIREQSEFMAYLSGEEPKDVFAWLTSPRMGIEEREWDDDAE